VVVVEEDHEDADVRPRRGQLLIRPRHPDAGQGLARELGRRVNPDHLERVHRLQDVVLVHLEVVLGEIEHRVAVVVGHEGVDADVVDAAPKDGDPGLEVGGLSRRGGVRFLGAGLGLRPGGGLRLPGVHGHHQQQPGAQAGGDPACIHR
jgi:hypothetical protein